MKKHDILFQAQEEAFIQALEEEMARETPDPNAIRAILDQLDRQTGGQPLTPTRAGVSSRPAGRPNGAGWAVTPWFWPLFWCAWRWRGRRWR